MENEKERNSESVNFWECFFFINWRLWGNVLGGLILPSEGIGSGSIRGKKSNHWKMKPIENF